MGPNILPIYALTTIP